MPSSQPELPLQIVEEDGRTIVQFPADTTLSEANAEEFGHALTVLTTGRDRPQLLVDLGTVSMVTSVILAKFLALNGRVRAAGGRLTLVNPSPIVRQVFKVTRLDTILDVQSKAHPIPA